MPRTPAGEFNQRVTFQRAATTRGALGGKNPGVPADRGARLAKVLWGTGSERRAAAVEGAVQAATFRFKLDSLTRSTLATDQLVHQLSGLTFDITGIAAFDRIGEVEFTGVASRG